MLSDLSQRWQLDMFPDGSKSIRFANHVTKLRSELERLTAILKAERIHISNEQGWRELLDCIQFITGGLREADSFVSCLNAQDDNDEEAQKLTGVVKNLYADYASALNYWENWFLGLNDQQWSELCQYDFIQSVEYPLQERRELAKEKLPPNMETLINELAVDGYHGWGEHYNT